MANKIKPPSYKTLAQKFGERVRAIRESKGKTQIQVAIDVDINRGYLSEVENGHKEMTLHMMADLASYFDMSLSELLTGL